MKNKTETLLAKYREAVRRRLFVERARREWEEARGDRSRELSIFERSLISREMSKFEEDFAAATAEIRSTEEALRLLLEEEEGTPLFDAERRAREALEATAAKILPRVQEAIRWAVEELGARVESRFGKIVLVFPAGLGHLSPPPSPETWPAGSFAAAAAELSAREHAANSFSANDRVRALLCDLPDLGQ